MRNLCCRSQYSHKITNWIVSPLQIASILSEQNCEELESFFSRCGLMCETSYVLLLVGPEEGLQPWMTDLVCGDFHTSTHVLMGALGFYGRTFWGWACTSNTTLNLKLDKNLLALRLSGYTSLSLYNPRFDSLSYILAESGTARWEHGYAIWKFAVQLLRIVFWSSRLHMQITAL